MFIEPLESRRLFSVVTLTADTTAVLKLQSGETLQGNGYSVGGLVGYDVSNVTVENLNIAATKGAAGSGINIYSDKAGTSGLTFNKVSVSGFASGYGVLIGTGGKGTISNLSLSNVTAFNNALAGISTYGATGSIMKFTLADSTAYDNTGVLGSNSPSGSGIMLAGLNGAIVQGCVAYGNGADNNAADGPVGIFAYDSNAVVIENCNSYDNMSQVDDGGGFDLDGGVTNSTIIDCVSSNNFGYGFAAFTFAGGAGNSGNSILDNVSTGDKEGFAYWSNGPAISNLVVSGNQFLDARSGYAIVGGSGLEYANITLVQNVYSPLSQICIVA